MSIRKNEPSLNSPIKQMIIFTIAKNYFSIGWHSEKLTEKRGRVNVVHIEGGEYDTPGV